MELIKQIWYDQNSTPPTNYYWAKDDAILKYNESTHTWEETDEFITGKNAETLTWMKENDIEVNTEDENIYMMKNLPSPDFVVEGTYDNGGYEINERAYVSIDETQPKHFGIDEGNIIITIPAGTTFSTKDINDNEYVITTLVNKTSDYESYKNEEEFYLYENNEYTYQAV